MSIRLAICIAGIIALSGCTEHLGLTSPTPKSAEIVVGDEPYAVRAAADVMAEGGNAVDAAVALYFSLAVTYPVAAGLGGGGLCLIHDPVKNQDVEYDFLVRDPVGKGEFGVPGNVRGFASIHAAYGALPWQRVVAASEGYGSTGFPISQALATRLAASENVIRLDAGLAEEFMDESGHVKPAGSIVTNRELAETLATIRTLGSPAFSTGPISEKIVAYSLAQGAPITARELAGYPVGQGDASTLLLGNQSIFLPRSSVGAGAFANTVLDNVRRALSTAQEGSNTEGIVVTATKQALSGYGVANLPGDLGATGFATMDANGEAVACAVTMNGPFGSGHTARGSGVTLAKAPSSSQAGLASAFLTPVVATDSDGRVLLVAAGAGGPVGTASIADALARLSKGEIVTRRGSAGDPNLALYDTMNAILCQDGGCSALLDAGANGLSASPSH